MKKKNLCIVIVIAAGCFILSGCQTGQNKAPKVLAEFEYSGNTNDVLLPVEFQGQIYQFVLDTGSSNSVFDINFKDKLGKQFPWPIPRNFRGALVHGKTAKGEVFPVPKSKIGPLELKGFPFVCVMDCNVFGGNIPGIIGMDFLKKYVVQIDFDNKKVTFLKGKKDYDLLFFLKHKQNKHPEWGEPISLKTKLFSECNYHVEGCFPGDIETDFLIDSGWAGPDGIKDKVLEEIERYVVQRINDVMCSLILLYL